MKVLIIIPAYNESENIEAVVTRLRTQCPEYDYLIVNDCSTDQTEQILQKNGFSYLSLPVNLGIGGAVQSGYLYATKHGYDATVQMDGDGQHDPAYLKDLLAPLEAGDADMVIGSRFIRREGFQTSRMRRMGSVFLRGVIRLCSGVKSTDPTSGFRACNKALTAFYANDYAQDYPEPEAIVTAARNGFRILDVPVVMAQRQGGVSSINMKKSLYYMIKVSLALVLCRIRTKKKKAPREKTAGQEVQS